jgi:hypothetical protein
MGDMDIMEDMAQLALIVQAMNRKKLVSIGKVHLSAISYFTLSFYLKSQGGDYKLSEISNHRSKRHHRKKRLGTQ